jgi:ABC-type antimicrobial peptide transport system permease subunit
MRQREFAIRLALGETGRGLLARVLKRTAVLVTVGLGAGIFVAWSGSRVIRGLLFGVAPDDPLTYAAVIAIVSVAIVTAAWLPARRATKVNPSAVLRGA